MLELQASIIYRVFNNEGQKVLGYKTMKKCGFEATKRLIASKNMGHFVIFVICLIISNKIYILKYMKKCTKLTKFDLFLCNLSQPFDKTWLDIKMSHIFGSYEPFGSLKSTFFPGFIAQYFLTFIIEHPVFQ